jgi:hypothetical protein
MIVFNVIWEKTAALFDVLAYTFTTADRLLGEIPDRLANVPVGSGVNVIPAGTFVA